MENPFQKIKAGFYLLSRGHVGALVEEVGRELWSEETSYGFRADLSLPVKTRSASVPITLRHFERSDMALLALDDMGQDLTKSVIDRLSRIHTIEAGIPSAVYVAVTSDGSPCFLQWLISPDKNDRLTTHYNGYFPSLARDEVLLEGAFVPERHRGKGIMVCAMAQVAAKARTMGARWAITWVEESNLPSIRGCLACGFQPYLKKRAIWRAFRRRLSFSPLSRGECESLEAGWQRPKGEHASVNGPARTAAEG